VNAVGKPDDRNGPVRFDEGVLETERWAARGGHSPKRGDPAWPRTPCTPPRQRPTLLVILCRGTAGQALAVTRRWMASLKLTLNEAKTGVRDARRECFDFLGYTFGPAVHRPTGRTHLAVRPSRRAVARLRDRVRAILATGNTLPWPEVVAALNRILRGWRHYFSYGSVTRAYWWVDAFVLHRARGFLARRHKVSGRGTRRFPAGEVFGDGGLISLGAVQRAMRSHA
jgi:RNA-directed DNA polymerase